MILVTGGSGLVGAYLLMKLLKSNETVYATKRSQTNLHYTENIFKHSNLHDYFSKIIWIDCDLTDRTEVENLVKKNDIKTIYHCAASVSYRKSLSKFIIESNVGITRNLVNVSIDNNVVLCHVSSIAALGESNYGSLINENTLWTDEHSSAYSKSKYLSELEVWRGISEGLNAVIIQPSVIIGGGFWQKGIGSIFSKIKKGMNFYTEGTTGFVDVRDVVNVMVTLVNKKLYGRSYIVNAENLSYKDFFSILAKKLNAKPPKFKAGKKLLAIAWRLEYIKSVLLNAEPVITSVSAKTAMKKLKYDNSKIKKELNYKFITIEQSLDYFSKWFNDTI